MNISHNTALNNIQCSPPRPHTNMCKGGQLINLTVRPVGRRLFITSHVRAQPGMYRFFDQADGLWWAQPTDREPKSSLLHTANTKNITPIFVKIIQKLLVCRVRGVCVCVCVCVCVN